MGCWMCRGTIAYLTHLYRTAYVLSVPLSDCTAPVPFKLSSQVSNRHRLLNYASLRSPHLVTEILTEDVDAVCM